MFALFANEPHTLPHQIYFFAIFSNKFENMFSLNYVLNTIYLEEISNI